MAGASATDFCTALASLASRLGSIELNADEIPASVMSPDAAELRSSFYDATIQTHLFPQEGWSGDGAAVVTAALKAVQEDEDAERLLLQQLKRLVQLCRTGTSIVPRLRRHGQACIQLRFSEW